MHIPFLENRFPGRRRDEPGGEPAETWPDHEGVARLLAECELLRDHALHDGVELDDTPAALEALDQLRPGWPDDPEELPWLGNDAGLYLGTVLVRTVSGARWEPGPDGTPTIALPSGRRVDVVAAGHSWAENGTPGLRESYADVAES